MMVLGFLVLVIFIQIFVRDGHVVAAIAKRISTPPKKVARAGNSEKMSHARTGCTGTSRLLNNAASLEGINLEPSVINVAAIAKTIAKSAQIAISCGATSSGLLNNKHTGKTKSDATTVVPAAEICGYFRKITKPTAPVNVIHKASKSPVRWMEPADPMPIIITPAKPMTLAPRTMFRGFSLNHNHAIRAVINGALP